MSGYDPYSGEPVPVDYGRTNAAEPQPVLIEPTEMATPPERRRKRRSTAQVIGIMLFIAPAAFLYLQAKSDRDEPPQPSSVDTVPEPEYVDAKPVRVIGPNWASNENTYTMQVGHWPFAFRTGPDWNCFGGKHEDFPGEQIEVCVGEKGQQLALMLRDCPGKCTAKDRRKMDREVFTDPKRARKFDRSTTYAQRRTAKSYTAELSRYIVEDGELRQLNVVAESPPGTRDVVLKAFNDVAGQTQRMRG